MTTLRVLGRNLPCSGGGWFRVLPYPAFRAGAAPVPAGGGGAGGVLHPSLGDRPGQPRLAVRSRLSRFRHYVNLARTAGRLERLLGDFAWDRMDQVFAGVLGAGQGQR